MADFGFLGSLGSRVKNYLGGAVGDVGEMGGRARQELFPSSNRMVSPLPPDMGRLVSPLPEGGGGQESDILASLRKSLGVKEEKGEKKEKAEMGSMTIVTPTPEGGKVTIKVDVPSSTPTQPPQWEGKAALPQDLWSMVQEQAGTRRMNPEVLASLLAQETGGFGYEPRRGMSGERGMTQIIPRLHYQESGAGATDLDSYANRLETDPQFAIQEAARILQNLLLNANVGNQSLPQRGDVFADYLNALAAYNAGEGNIPGGLGYAREVLGRVGLQK